MQMEEMQKLMEKSKHTFALARSLTQTQTSIRTQINLKQDLHAKVRIFVLFYLEYQVAARS